MAVVGVFPYNNGQTFVGGVVNKKNQGHLLPVSTSVFRLLNKTSGIVIDEMLMKRMNF